MTRSQHRELLYSLNGSTSNTHPRTSVLLNGTTLTPVQLRALIALHKQSFVTIPVAPHTATPPPSPSEIPQEGPWRITPSDITAPPEGPWSPDSVPQPSISKAPDTPDYGMSFFVIFLYVIEVA